MSKLSSALSLAAVLILLRPGTTVQCRSHMTATQSIVIKHLQNLELKTVPNPHTFLSKCPCCKKYSNPLDSALCLLYMGSDGDMELHIISIKTDYFH